MAFAPPAPTDIISGGFQPPSPADIITSSFKPPTPNEIVVAPQNPYTIARPKLNEGLESTTAGAPQQLNAGAPGSGAGLGRALAQAAKDAQSISFLDAALPEAQVDPQDSKKAAAAKEVYNLLASVPKFMTSGAGFESMIPGTALPKLTKAAFSASMAKDLYDTVKTAYKNWDTMTPAQKTQAVVHGVGTGLFAGALGVSSAKDAADLIKSKGGEINAIQKRSAETPVVGDTPGRSAPVGEGIPQPKEAAGTQEANTQETRKVNPYRLEQEEGGKWAITAPDGSIVSTHDSLQDARVAMDDAKKSPALKKSAPQQVKFIGEQEGFKGSPSIKLFNLTQPIVDASGKEVHSAGSTVSEGTLKKYGILVPETSPKSPPLQTKPSVPEVPKLSPEAQGHLDDVSKELGAKVDLVSEAESGNPFASRLKGNIATIDRNTGKVLVNPEQFESWLKEVPHNQRRLAVKSVIAEEQNHLATDDSAAKAYWSTLSGPEKKIIQNRYGQAPNMNDTLWGHEAVNFELQRLARMTPHQVLAAARGEKWKLKSLAVLETTIRGIRKVLGTKASQEGLAILDQVQQNLRLGRIALSARGKADAAAKALADKDADKLDSLADMHIQSGDPETGEAMKKTAARIRGETPFAQRRETYPYMGVGSPADEYGAIYGPKLSPDQIAKFKSQEGREFAIESEPDISIKLKIKPSMLWVEVRKPIKPGSSSEDQAVAYLKIRSDGTTVLDGSKHGRPIDELAGRKLVDFLKNVSGEKTVLPDDQSILPAARPRKRNESVFQDKFFLPGEATQKPAGSTQAVPISGEAPTVPPEDRVSAEAAGALPRLTGVQLQERASGWLQKAASDASEAMKEGKTAEIPTFKDFVGYMQGQQPEIKPGQLAEMWHEEVGKFLEKASGEQLGDLVKAIWGRQVTEASAVGRKGFFRRIISGSQKVADLPKSGQFKVAQDVYNRTPAERYQDERKVAAIARNRDKVIGALFNKLVKPVTEDIRLSDKETTPEDLRYGGGKAISAVHEFSEQDERNPKLLGEELVDESRRSKNDPLTASKRLTAIMDRKSGTVDMVSTYKHPALGTMLVDPLSPERQHSPLDSILRRYRVIGSYLRDTPVQKFKQHFKNLADFNDSFANEARRQYQNETSYNPESVSAEQFQREIGGRMQGTQEGHLMGPGKQLVTASGQSQLEKSQRTPMTTPEAYAILDYIHEQQGTIDSADDVREAMMALKEDMNHQALSGLIKLARGLQEKNPDLSNEELLNLVAQRIYENNRDAESLEGFTQRTMAESRPTHVEDAGPEDSPAAINRKRISEERSALNDDVKTLATRTMASFLRSPTRERMTSSVDAADTLANNEARNVEQSIRLSSVDEKNFYGKPEVLAGAKAKIAAGAIKARYHYDQNALDEADRLKTEDEKIKGAASWESRPRNLKDPKQAAEQKAATDQLNQMIQKQLIESGFLNHTEATYYHDTAAKDKLDEYMFRVSRGLEAAARLAKGDLWDRYRASRWKKGAEKLMEELQFAKAHWDNPELIDTAMRARRELDQQFDLEKQNGYNISYDPDYMPGRYDGELFSQYGVLFSGLRVMGKQFRSAKAFQTYYHAIEAGPYIPASYDTASIVSSRVRQGMRSLNRNLWWNSLHGLKDEVSGKPIAAVGKTVHGKLTAPSPEYSNSFRAPSGDTVYVLDGYEHLVHQLVDPSALQHVAFTRGALNASQFLKHTVLLGDLFHLGRVLYYGASISGFESRWRPGWAALDFRESDLPRAVEKNLISKETAAWLTEKLPFNANGVLTTMNRMELSRQFQRQGFNVGQIGDAIYKDLVSNVPGFGRYNKFLFDRFTRGQMMNAALREYERRNRLSPGEDSRNTMREISKDLNNYFGSIGRQGWIKSATFQDIARLTFLAPQWLEGLVKKEVSPVRLLTQPKKVLSGNDTMLRGIGRGMLGMVVLTQVVNLITRGQPTWMNQEKEHKWDADFGNNVWLSPLAVFNELTGDLLRLGQTKPKAWDAVQQVGENKLGFFGRAGIVLITGKSSSGEYQTTTAGVIGNAASQLIPTPISFGTAARAIGHAVAPNQVSPVPPGRMTAQMLSSMGFKTHTGMSLETRMEHSAAAFNQAHGKTDPTIIGYTSDPSYSQLRYFLSIGDAASAKKMLGQLEKTRPAGKVIQAMDEWVRRPYTGSKRSEALWLGGMDDAERAQYQQAIQERYKLLSKFRDSLNQ
jgi:hypothetical protein